MQCKTGNPGRYGESQGSSFCALFALSGWLGYLGYLSTDRLMAQAQK
jgi:hypothetical protein